MAYNDYSAPAYDEGRVQSLTQTSAAGAIRGLRSAMQGAANGSFANPNVRRMTLRDALAGYGQGLQSAISAASDTARGLYNTEYSAQADTGMVFDSSMQSDVVKIYSYEVLSQISQNEDDGSVDDHSLDVNNLVVGMI